MRIINETVILRIIASKIAKADQNGENRYLSVFFDLLHDWYWFTKGHFEAAMREVSIEEYRNAFFRLVTQGWFKLPSTFKNGISLYYASSALSNLSTSFDALRELQQEIFVYQATAAKLAADTKEIRFILEKQCNLGMVVTILSPLLRYFSETESNRSQILTFADIFNFGYIEGVRSERARRRKDK